MSKRQPIFPHCPSCGREFDEIPPVFCPDCGVRQPKLEQVLDVATDFEEIKKFLSSRPAFGCRLHFYRDGHSVADVLMRRPGDSCLLRCCRPHSISLSALDWTGISAARDSDNRVVISATGAGTIVCDEVFLFQNYPHTAVSYH
jgi:hypothetical protein